MKIIFDLLITFILRIIGYISSHLSIPRRNKLGYIIGVFFRLLSPQRKRIAINNIRKALPGNTDDWYRTIVKKSYHNLGIIVAEVSAMGSYSENTINNMIKYNNLDLLIKKYNEGRGLLLLSGHFGNWELLAYSAGLFTKIPILIVVKPQKNKSSDKIINKYRIRAGNQVISMHRAAREIIKNIQDGHAIALLADQSATTDKDIFVNFFGMPSTTYKAPAELALKYNVPVICAFPVRKSDFTYEADIIELKHEDLNDNEEGIYEFTKRYLDLLEEAIRKNPELWVWQHRRWKHSI